MVSNTHEEGHIVVSEEITLTSPPTNTYGSNNAETSSSNLSALSKNEEQLKSSVQNDSDNAENKRIVAENLPSVSENDLSVEAIAVDNENELSHIEEFEEMNICDTCGDQGHVDLLVICSRCKVGAEHTYCMWEKAHVPPNEWICYECTNDRDGVPEEETSSMERKVESSYKMEERALSQKQPDSLNIGLAIDRNIDPNIDMNEQPSSKKRKTGPSIDFPKMAEASSQADLLKTKSRDRILWLDLNKEPNPDFDEDPNI